MPGEVVVKSQVGRLVMVAVGQAGRGFVAALAAEAVGVAGRGQLEALEARFAELSSVSDYFLALADYRAAIAEELR